MIFSEKVSFQINLAEKSSYIMFGESDTKQYIDPVSYQNPVKHELNQWMVNLNQIYYGNQSIHTSAVSTVVLDSSQGKIFLSRTDYLNFKDSVKKVLTCNNLWNTYCYSNDYYCNEIED